MSRPTAVLAPIALLLTIATANAATLTTEPFGTTRSGQPVSLTTMTAADGVTIKFMSYGGIITQILTPDRNGRTADIVLGFPTLEGYETDSAAGGLYFGAARRPLRQPHRPRPFHPRRPALHVGHQQPAQLAPRRPARLRQARLDRRTRPDLRPRRQRHAAPDQPRRRPGLPRRDEDRRHLLTVRRRRVHAPLPGHHQQGHGAEPHQPLLLQPQRRRLARRRLRPGPDRQRRQLHAHRRDLDPARPQRSRRRHRVSTSASPPPSALTSAIPRPSSSRPRGYDHNWVINPGAGSAPTFAARLSDPSNGRTLDVLTTQPGVQIYTANFLKGIYAGTGGVYRQTDGITFETQHFPDSPNQPAFPTTELKPGETFDQTTIFKFGVTR